MLVDLMLLRLGVESSLQLKQSFPKMIIFVALVQNNYLSIMQLLFESKDLL